MNSISFPSPTQSRLNSSNKPLVSSLSPQVLFNFSRVITSKRYQINAWNKWVATVFDADQRVENRLRRGPPTPLTYVQQPPTNHSQPLRYIPAMARTPSEKEAGNLSSSPSNKDSKRRKPGLEEFRTLGKRQRVDEPETPVMEAPARGYMSGRPKTLKETQSLPNIQGKNKDSKGNSDDTIPPEQKRLKGEGAQSTSDEIGTPIEQPSINEANLEIEALCDKVIKMKEEMQEVTKELTKIKEQLQIMQALLESCS